MAQLRCHGSSESPPALTDSGSKPPPMPALEQNSAIGPNWLLGLLDDVGDVLFLADVAFEGRAVDGAGHRARRIGIDVGDHDPGGAGAVERLAHGAADAVAAARDDHDLAGHLHGTLPALFLSLFCSAYFRTMSSTAV